MQNSGEAVGAFGDTSNSVGSMVDREHGSHDSEQHLRGADVAGGLLPANVLLAGLQGHTQCAIAEAVNGYANNPAGYAALKFLIGGEKRSVRTTKPHWHAKALRTADDDIGTKFSRRCQHRQGQQI